MGMMRLTAALVCLYILGVYLSGECSSPFCLLLTPVPSLSELRPEPGSSNESQQLVMTTLCCGSLDQFEKNGGRNCLTVP